MRGKTPRARPAPGGGALDGVRRCRRRVRGSPRLGLYGDPVAQERVVRIRGDVVSRPPPAVDADGAGPPPAPPRVRPARARAARLRRPGGARAAGFGRRRRGRLAHQLDLAGVRSAGALLRAVHDASRSWSPPPDAVWAVPSFPGPVICHGNPQPANLAWRAGRAVGLFDWDAARPAEPLSDVAAALLWFTRSTPTRTSSGVGASPASPTGSPGPGRCSRATAGTSRSTSSRRRWPGTPRPSTRSSGSASAATSPTPAGSPRAGPTAGGPTSRCSAGSDSTLHRSGGTARGGRPRRPPSARSRGARRSAAGRLPVRSATAAGGCCCAVGDQCCWSPSVSWRRWWSKCWVPKW